MLDNNLMFYLAGCIYFLFVFISKRKVKSKDERYALLKKAFEKRELMLPSLQDEVNKFIDDKKVKKWSLK